MPGKPQLLRPVHYTSERFEGRPVKEPPPSRTEGGPFHELLGSNKVEQRAEPGATELQKIKTQSEQAELKTKPEVQTEKIESPPEQKIEEKLKEDEYLDRVAETLKEDWIDRMENDLLNEVRRK
jgi:hypothetical protein